jgi:hypothetical protein
MMEVLMVDPRLFHKRACWSLVVITGRVVLNAFVRGLHNQQLRGSGSSSPSSPEAGGGGPAGPKRKQLRRQSLGGWAPRARSLLAEKDLGQLAVAVLRITVEVVRGAREVTSGPVPEEKLFAKRLVGASRERMAPDTLLFAARRIAPNKLSNARRKPPPRVGASFAEERSRPSTPADAAPLAASCESLLALALSGHAFGALNNLAVVQIKGLAEALLTLLLPSSPALRDAAAARASLGARGPKSNSDSFSSTSGAPPLPASASAAASGSNPAAAVQAAAAAEEAARAATATAAAQQATAIAAAAATAAAVDESLADAACPPTLLYAMYTQALIQNPHIKQIIMRQRFTLESVLENAGALTEPGAASAAILAAAPEKKLRSGSIGGALSPSSTPRAGKKGKPGPLPAAIQVTWDKVVARFVRYLQMHNYDKKGEEAETCLRIFASLCAHLLKARSNPDGTLVDLMATDSSLDPAARELRVKEYGAKQDHLEKLDVTQCALLAVATHEPSVRGNAADAALSLLAELVRYRNQRTQAAVLAFIARDHEGKLLLAVKARLAAAKASVVERQSAAGGVGFEPTSATQRGEFAEASRTLNLLQLLVGGHHRALQNALRAQEGRDVPVNLVLLCAELFVLQAEYPNALGRMEDAEVGAILKLELECLLFFRRSISCCVWCLATRECYEACGGFPLMRLLCVCVFFRCA